MNSFDIQLSPFERQLMDYYRRAGAKGIIGLVTLVSVLGSVFVTMVLVYPFLDSTVTDDGFWYFFGGSVGVPLLIAPLATTFFARLLVLLDRSFQIVESLSTTDPLTGSVNRRGFFSLAEQNTRALQENSACFVGMVDLNNFKTLNDTHGHPAGDAALVAFARSLQECIGDSGTVGRIGGDEFALLIVDEPERLQSIEAEIKKRCQSLSFTTEANVELTLSACVGIVQLASDDSFDGALGRADGFLYAEKQKRRETHPSTVRSASRASNGSDTSDTKAGWDSSGFDTAGNWLSPNKI